MSKSTLGPRKQPRQARATAMVEHILQAATRVLGTESLAGFNTNRVAEVAGISIGSLYQYFPNKSALVVALIDRAQSALAEAIEQCIVRRKGSSFTRALAELVDIAIEHQFGNPTFAAALDHEEQRLPLHVMLDASRRRMASAVEGLLLEHRSAFGRALPGTAAQDCLIIAKALIESESNSIGCDQAALKRRVLRALTGYLGYNRRSL